MTIRRWTAVLAATLGMARAGAAGAPASCPLEASGSGSGHADCPLAAGGHSHSEAVRRRGEKGMGFSQETTVHHFRLGNDGGAIEVAVRNGADGETRREIRLHLAHIREMFAAGDFSIPMFVHDGVPPGIGTMKRRAASIRYGYEDLPAGGRVTISTADPDALDAVHDFLRFQIVEHETGDPVAVPAKS
ncbi:MAG TPA: hypothetical protein VFL12_11110 [Thermoanaerobaculia bacterium]|nr:hypothetical protein [Thermoanaerobaculia bacterium]